MKLDDEVCYRGFAADTVAGFKRFHPENPLVFRIFKKLAREAKEVGFNRYSGRNISEKMRWDHNFATRGEPFKLNNKHVAIYVRLLIYRYPREFVGFFELRVPGSRKQGGGLVDVVVEEVAMAHADWDDV